MASQLWRLLRKQHLLPLRCHSAEDVHLIKEGHLLMQVRIRVGVAAVQKDLLLVGQQRSGRLRTRKGAITNGSTPGLHTQVEQPQVVVGGGGAREAAEHVEHLVDATTRVGMALSGRELVLEALPINLPVFQAVEKRYFVDCSKSLYDLTPFDAHLTY